MLTAFARAFKTPDLRKKLLFTLGIIVLFRLGQHIPIPGIDYKNVQTCMDLAKGQQGLFGLVNMFSGGALLQITIFALGIMPYITASIILQLLTVVIPRLEALKKEGQSGQAKITQYTRYLTIALAILQGTGLVATARSGSLFQSCPVGGQIVRDDSIFTTAVMVITMTAGTALIMWLGELVTDRGIGNGMSILMFVSIAAGFPSAMWSIKQQGKIMGGWLEFGLVILCGLAMVGLVVFVEQAQRRIPVQYAKRMIGRRSYGGTSTYIPMKVNQAGVIPVIFASSLLYIPALIVQFSNSKAGWATWISQNFVKGDHPIYIATYFLLIVFFAFFYVAISFNPEEVADNMKKYGGFIPGIRAGRPTAEYLSYVLNRITWPGALYLGLIALVPTVALVTLNANQNFPFGGTSILIIVGVGLETVKQIESQLQQRHYEGFLR
ncbi:preprotein translocase subunit SecY [Streptomyces samsunensis]|uniref:Protein translocase subunit SecY n=3 Tax=Streptomyces TaxID=1883 RepID=A0A291SUY7_STRMQ|nr:MULTISPECIES: preprotein translocase subunit SecY [Streptomyces]MYU10825.1 preprotein translocase subunit SecY [Streptomyces sp. SID8361]MYX57401.1 preprotein translocase subunit SecY [Streptomyces sp. SID8382]AQA13399.1 preprotein translocase subunit SecY [Streptomyces autolyticus]ATL84696.1 preprotein translocase, SecY subunit [Streptomyces malaysiensis]AUA12021.1 preprotein translocase subunit SecY [Streptomyces sp. M56]